jgi:hypothetical protein
MARTAEQEHADDALTAAINLVRVAYFGEESARRLLTDYVVVFAEQTIDDDGDVETVTGTLVREGNLAGYRIAGLLTTALADRAIRTVRPEE